MSAKQHKLDASHSRQEKAITDSHNRQEKAIKDSLENQSDRLNRTEDSEARGSHPFRWYE